jgi:fatty acid-binding protein DegV
LAIIHGNVEADAQQMLTKALEQFPTEESYVSVITAVLGVHVGPGAIGIIVQWDGE